MNDYRLQTGKDCFTGYPAPFQLTPDKTLTRTQKQTLKSSQPRYQTARLGRTPAPPQERGQEQTLRAPRPPGMRMTALSERPRQPRHRSSPGPAAVGTETLRPRLPASPMAERHDSAGVGKWHQRQNQGDVGWSRRCSDCRGQNQLGHRVSLAPTTLPAQGSQQGTSPQTRGSPRHPDGVAGKPGCRDAAAW